MSRYQIEKLLGKGRFGKVYSAIFSEEKSVFFIEQVINALIYLQENKIIHRDIKPENILLSNDKVKICDFGWAVKLEDPLICRRKTFCGTLDYMAPEIVIGEEYAFNVDVWSLGVLAFELLTGEAPFWAERHSETFTKIILTNFTVPENVSEEAKDFICGILQKEPDLRNNLDLLKNHKWIKKYQKELI